MLAEIPSATFSELFLWIIRRRKHFRVTGNSMQPLLKPGDIVLVDLGAYRIQEPGKGDVVIAWHPYWTELRMVKRVQAINPDGTLALVGDNPEETTDFGSISADKILGRVTSKFA